MRKTLVILVGGLSPSLIGEHTPHLVALAKRGAMRPLQSVTPALSCVAQSSMVTGLAPAEHGVVGNGWYFRDRAETAMWQQSNRLVSGEKIWEAGKRRDPAF